MLKGRTRRIDKLKYYMEILGMNKREVGDEALWRHRVRVADSYNLERRAKKTILSFIGMYYY